MFQMTLLLLSGVWKHSISVSGTLDQSEEATGQFHGSNNHVHEGAHSHEDGFCDCNSQGKCIIQLIKTIK